ncbi:hypothetical protein [Coleofasciculus sp. F4-SAH-05]|uniref:hypothetical protein n=1 Tax=unclassified Coleofasciculus TaxID=2692782 RepID=UPI003300F3DD
MRVISKDTIYREALERAVSILTENYPDRAQRLQHTLDVVTQDIINHPHPAKAWSYSSLNKDGAPVEFTFSSLDDDLRYAVEVGGPDIFSEDRLTRASQLLSILAPEAPFGEIVSQFKQVQAEGILSWGAWLGIRHQRDRDRYKIYAQVPKKADNGTGGAAELIARYLGQLPSLLGNRRLELISVGQAIGSTRCEFYFLLSGLGLQEAEIAHLLEQFGLQHHQPALLELLRSPRKTLFGTPDSAPLPEVKYALSCSVLPGNQQPIVSIFTKANQYLGGDGFIRYAVMVTAYRRGWPFETYSIFTQPIGRQIRRCAHHNVLGFIVVPDAEPGLHISLSSPFPQ